MGFEMMDFSWLSALAEIAILFFVFYGAFYYLRGSRGSLIIFGIFLVWLVLALLARKFNFNVISYLFELIGSSLVVILFVLFQPELRRLLAQLGSFTVWQGKRRREMIGEIVSDYDHLEKLKEGVVVYVTESNNES